MSLSALRQKTGGLHQRLEKNLDLFARVRTKADYKDHLSRYHRWLLPVEERIMANQELQALGYDFSPRTTLLQMDLTALGSSFPGARPGQERDFSLAACIGYLYVIEGSRLGGQVISKHYAELLGLDSSNGLAFYSGHGANTAANWKSFVGFLENYFLKHPSRANEVYSAACDAFFSIENCLCSAEPLELHHESQSDL